VITRKLLNKSTGPLKASTVSKWFDVGLYRNCHWDGITGGCRLYPRAVHVVVVVVVFEVFGFYVKADGRSDVRADVEAHARVYGASNVRVDVRVSFGADVCVDARVSFGVDVRADVKGDVKAHARAYGKADVRVDERADFGVDGASDIRFGARVSFGADVRADAKAHARAYDKAEPSGRIFLEANGTGVVGKGVGFFGGEAVARELR
jgi:hypothetical protein